MFGAANPAFTAYYDGLLNGDSPTVVTGTPHFTTATTTAHAGTYPITVSGLSALNYQLTNTPGHADRYQGGVDHHRGRQGETYGAAMPGLTAVYTGLTGGAGPASLVGTLSLTTPATAGSGVGTYAISVGGVTSPDFDITFVNGTLTINKAALQ